MCLKDVILKPRSKSNRLIIGYKAVVFKISAKKCGRFHAMNFDWFFYSINSWRRAKRIADGCAYPGCEKYPHGIHVYLSLDDAIRGVFDQFGQGPLYHGNLCVIAVQFREKDILAYGEIPHGWQSPAIPAVVVGRVRPLPDVPLGDRYVPAKVGHSNFWRYIPGPVQQIAVLRQAEVLS